MTPVEIRMLTGRLAATAQENEDPACASGTSAVVTMLGEIAAQLAEFNQNFFDFKRQIVGGFINAAVKPPKGMTK